MKDVAGFGGNGGSGGAEAPAAELRPLFLSEEDNFNRQMRLAAAAHRNGRLEEAITSYMRLLAVRPYHAELHNNLGVALRIIGKLDAAVAHHRTSLALDPNNAALHSNLGNALRAANRLDEAVRHHFRAVSLKPDYAEGVLQSGTLSARPGARG